MLKLSIMILDDEDFHPNKKYERTLEQVSHTDFRADWVDFNQASIVAYKGYYGFKFLKRKDKNVSRDAIETLLDNHHRTMMMTPFIGMLKTKYKEVDVDKALEIYNNEVASIGADISKIGIGSDLAKNIFIACLKHYNKPEDTKGEGT